MAPPPRLAFTGLSLAFGDRTLVRDLSFALAAGEIAALVAPSGTGKTTLLRATVRLGEVASGTIALDGVGVTTLDGPGLRRRIRLVAQQPALLGPTVADDLAAGAPPAEPPAAEDVADLLGEVGIDPAFASRESAGLSGGEQARVAVARALAGNPSVVLLDEPSAALDEAATTVLAQCLRSRAASGLTVLMATHDPALLATTAARVIDLPTPGPPRAG